MGQLIDLMSRTSPFDEGKEVWFQGRLALPAGWEFMRCTDCGDVVVPIVDTVNECPWGVACLTCSDVALCEDDEN